MKPKILLVEDEPAIRFGLRGYLEANGYEVCEAESCQEARAQFLQQRADAILLDYLLPDGNALQLIPQLREAEPHVPLVVLTGHGSIDLAVEAMKRGADHFLTKPVSLEAVDLLLQRLLENQRNRQRHAARSRREQTREPFLGDSPAIRALREQVLRITNADSPVLLLGETGSGKGVLARWIHENSPRAAEPFVDLNCAGLSRDLLESELFGHEKGAFTGANSAKQGLFEVAHHGTLFLDEIGDIDLQVQPKLLKVLEDKRFRRLGEVRDRVVELRLIAATQADLSALVREKRFRSDLYFRLSTIPITIPPLRERRDDILTIAHRLLRELASSFRRPNVALHPEAEAALLRYSWPGNIRELKNVLERAILLAEQELIRVRDLRFEESPPAAPLAGLQLTLAELERRYIEQVLREEGGHVDSAAVRLGIPRSTLYQKLKRFGTTRER